MWKLLLIPVVLVGIAIGFLFCWVTVETFKSTDYTYKGNAEVTLEQYKTISSAVGDGEKLEIIYVSDSKLGVLYDFKSFHKYDFISSVNQEWPWGIGVIMGCLGFLVFILCFAGMKDIYNSVKRSIHA